MTALQCVEEAAAAVNTPLAVAAVATVAAAAMNVFARFQAVVLQIAQAR